MPIVSQTVTQIVDKIKQIPMKSTIYLFAPVVRGRKGEYKKEILNYKKRGFSKIKVDGKYLNIDEFPDLNKKIKHDISIIVDRIIINSNLGNRLADSVETALSLSDGLMIVEFENETLPKKFRKRDSITFSSKFSCPESGFTIEEIEPRLFSFNSPFGACEHCDGLGTEYFIDRDLVIPNKDISIRDGAIAPWSRTSSPSPYYLQTLMALSEHYGFSIDCKWSSLTEKFQKIILDGSEDEKITFNYDDGSRTFKTSKPFEGILNNLKRRYLETDSNWMREEIEKYQSKSNCSKCNGYRLKEEALCIKINKSNIGDISKLTIDEAILWFGNLQKKLSKKDTEISRNIIKEITERLFFLKNVGLNYLTLSRESGTLSGGESQRIRLASQIGSGLTGVLYVLDEPSIGLHQRDNDKLLGTLSRLKDLGNTVIVVEHDEETMNAADHIIDIGPGAGIHGGYLVAEGTFKEIAKNKKSITGQYLSKSLKIDIPKKREINKDRCITITNASGNNLKNVTANFPLSTLTCVTGVSGSGKSTLLLHTLFAALNRKLNNSQKTPMEYDQINGIHYIDKIIDINQSPIGRTPRSNPATYTGAFTPIRDWFCQLPEAKARGYKPGRFSFNVKGGRCETCQGDGVIKIEMHFLPDVYVECDQCKGQRYNRETLEVKYKDKSIADVLNMTVTECSDLFKAVPLIRDKMETLKKVGLGYIKVGQQANTLSGGEAQRIKLAKELSKKATGRTFYVLDEPTTGLHFDDVKKLLEVLHELVENGNTVVVIEHNLDVIKTADWILDIGPDGGDKGGELVYEGELEGILKIKNSYTGKYLKKMM